MNNTNYSKMSTTPAVVEVDNKIDSVVTPAIAEPEEVEDIIEEIEEVNKPSTVEGFVSGCNRLNVRKEPETTAPVVCVIDVDSIVIIDEYASTDSFYKVYTETGAEGYCMKKFITITQ